MISSQFLYQTYFQIILFSCNLNFKDKLFLISLQFVIFILEDQSWSVLSKLFACQRRY